MVKDQTIPQGNFLLIIIIETIFIYHEAIVQYAKYTTGTQWEPEGSLSISVNLHSVCLSERQTENWKPEVSLPIHVNLHFACLSESQREKWSLIISKNLHSVGMSEVSERSLLPSYNEIHTCSFLGHFNTFKPLPNFL